MAAVPAYQIGAFFRRKHAPELPVRDTASGQVFLVKRGLMAGLGWACAILGLACGALLTIVEGMSTSPILAGIASVAVGAFFIISARNVREIRIDDHRIQFLPVGASLPLNEISGIKPSAKGGAPAYIELNMKTPRSRFIPGAILQWDGGCKLNIVGSNGDAVLSALRQRLPSA